MSAPLMSTITLLTEILVSVGVYTVLWQGYKHDRFIRVLAFGVLIYEALFNITYMTSRLWMHVEPSPAATPTSTETALAIFHGIFSIIMFLALIAFFIIASIGYSRGENYFLNRRTLAATFSIAWFISVLSGIIFYGVLYL